MLEWIRGAWRQVGALGPMSPGQSRSRIGSAGIASAWRCDLAVQSVPIIGRDFGSHEPESPAGAKMTSGGAGPPRRLTRNARRRGRLP